MRSIRLNKELPLFHKDFNVQDWRSQAPIEKNFGGQAHINTMRGNFYWGNGERTGHKYYITQASQHTLDLLSKCDFEAYAELTSPSSPTVSTSLITMVYEIAKTKQ